MTRFEVRCFSCNGPIDFLHGDPTRPCCAGCGLGGDQCECPVGPELNAKAAAEDREPNEYPPPPPDSNKIDGYEPAVDDFGHQYLARLDKNDICHHCGQKMIVVYPARTPSLHPHRHDWHKEYAPNYRQASEADDFRWACDCGQIRTGA